jgi:hypothetical protein
MREDERMARLPGVDDDAGGDAACWLPSLCAECGAMIEGPPGAACWRCGARASRSG